MASKESVSYQILKKYGFLVDGPKDALVNLNIKELPKKKSKETFNQWKLRVFGDKVEIEVYQKTIPDPRPRIFTLTEFSGQEHLQSIFEKYGKFKDKKTEERIKSKEEEVTKRYTSFSRESLEMLLEEQKENLQEPVVEFVNRYLQNADEFIDAEEMLTDLIIQFNNTVTNFRKAKQ